MEPGRYPVSVRLIGVLHKEKSKMFMTSVLWSDQNDIAIYRKLEDFKKMHKQVKKDCTTDRKMKKSERVLPRFRLQGGGRMGKKTTKSVVFLKSLEKYCNDLLNCEARISQSSSLIKFFQPNDQDLDREFPKNCIMIMQTDAENCSNRDRPDGNVTQPFVSETYRCMATYETKDTRNKPFKVAVDDKLDVLIKDRTGWWLVENEEKRMAWFPAPYLEKIYDNGDDDDDDETSERGKLYTATKNYTSTCDDEISVTAGAVVEIQQKSENGWWLVRHKGKIGYIPAMYLQPYNHPKVHMPSLQHERQPSPSALSLQQQSQHSLSYGNLLNLPLSSSPNRQEGIMQRSHSTSELQESQPMKDHFVPATRYLTPTTPTIHSPPIIMVETNGNEHQNRFRILAKSEESLDWESASDESLHSSFSLTPGIDERSLYHSRTPPPMMNSYLSPTSNTEVRMTPSVSDPNLYKVPTSPKVPPRPQAREILTRCTTVTRKNADKGNISPLPREIFSR
uniref:NADPH oxidase organizer 1a n=1 Tax=Oryzias latipes TaxID=8090 RepID=A0A3P9MH71_ORYLA